MERALDKKIKTIGEAQEKSAEFLSQKMEYLKI
jgi:hypothetical protein